MQNRISKEINDSYLGSVQTVLAEGQSKTNPEVMTGRTEGGKVVNFTSRQPVKPGQLVAVAITQTKTWSLEGEQTE